MKATKLWVGFRMCRVVVFAIATIISMGLSVIYAILLLREWKFYSNAQRAIMIMILATYGFSTILLYLMIIVRFRLWLDGARVAFLALFQGGATVTFTIFKPSLPCNNLGTVQTCKTVSTVAIFVGWSLAGLLVLYAFCLAVMSFIPQPPPPTNPEESLSDYRNKSGHSPSPSVISSASSRTWVLDSRSDTWKDEKRRSLISDEGSDYSQFSWIGSRATTPHIRSPSLASQGTVGTEQYGVYRPNTPQSIRSPAASSISSSVYPSSIAPNYNAGRFTPQSSGFYSDPSTPFSPPKTRAPLLPNPFLELPSRSGTPASVASFRSDGFLYAPQYAHTRGPTGHPIPSSLLAGGRLAPPPAYVNQSRQFLPGNVRDGLASSSPRPELMLERFNNSTPFSLQPGVSTGDTRGSMKSPDAVTVVSQSASIHIPPNRRASLLSVPRSPSPSNISPHVGLPPSPRALVLPAHPRLYPVNLRGPQRFQEVRRFGSSPDLRIGAPVAGVQRAPSVDPMMNSRQLVPAQRSTNPAFRPLPRASDQAKQVRFTPEQK